MINKLIRSLVLLTLILSFAKASGVNAKGALAAATASTFTFADLGESDFTIKAIYDQETVHFPFAEGRKVSSAVLNLHLSHSPKLLPELSDLVIGLNNEPVANLIFSADNANDSVIAIALPVEALKPGDNVLVFRFNLHLINNGCSDVGSADLWAKIFSDSTITFDGSDAPGVIDLSRFPEPFATFSTIPGNPQVSIILPADPTPAELSAATEIAASLGQAGSWEFPPLWAFTYDQLDQARADSDALIVIDTSGRNPLANSASPGLTETLSPFNSNQIMLIVSGADDAALLQSADLLSTQSARALLSGAHVPPANIVPQSTPDRETRMAFLALGLQTNRVRGIGLHDLYYPIDVPYDWKTTSDASVDLRFTHGRGLSSASLMTALINGFEVANVRLDARNDTDGQLIIQLSPRQIHVGRNWLHLVFDLHMQREDCAIRYLDEAWADVSDENSILNLAHVVSEAPLDLNDMPAHLVTLPDLSSNVFVLPAKPSSADLTAMVRAAAKLGTYSDADGLRPRSTTADRFAAQISDFASADVIAIGGPSTNELLDRYDVQLPQSLRLINGVILPATGRELLPEEQTGLAGYIEILPAPWSQRGSLVVLSAPDADQLFRVVDSLPTSGKRMKIDGNVAVITQTNITGFTLGALAGASLSPTARIVIAVILIGTFIMIGTIGIILNRLSRRRKIAR
jgi:hypothetical protein